MSFLLNKITDHNNLYWAWLKAKSFYRPGDIWFNELEVSKFELNLAEELTIIREDILKGNYQLNYIKPIAFPKGRNDEGPRTRQSFWISVRDQVTWLAVVNIIGRYFDAKMPFWSYGNRLYISMFYDNTLKFGYYRNTSNNTYRKWSQSWPLYRRHINLTTKFLTRKSNFIEELDSMEQKVIEINESLQKHPLKSEYLDKDYWNKNTGELFWAALDLEKFYPSIHKEVIYNNLVKYLPEEFKSEEFNDLVFRLLNFQIDYTGWSDEELAIVNLQAEDSNFPHLPTGLFVAGFLANIALFEVDKEVQNHLNDNRHIAHFRYVDDHVILATSFDELLNWIKMYEEILVKYNIGTTFNPTKTEPSGLAEYFKSMPDSEGESINYNEAKKQCELDPDFPSPLMTKTLSKVSKIAGTAFNLLSPEEEKNLISDVEHLLVTEFPDHELRKDTRVSFAARMLTMLVPQLSFDSNEEYRLHKNICIKRLVINQAKKDKSEENKPLIAVLEEEEKLYMSDLQKEKTRLDGEEQRMALNTIKLLCKAIQDNHDKVRLWGRLMEFFLRSGIGNATILVGELKKLEQKREINELSKTFINALILQVLANLLFDALKILTGRDNSSKKKQRATKFLINLFHKDLFDYFSSNLNYKEYEVTSLEKFMTACRAVISAIDSEDIKLPADIRVLKIIRESNSQIIDRKSKYDYSVWSWWLFSKLPRKNDGREPYLWYEIINGLPLDKVMNFNVLLLNLTKIPYRNIKQLDLNLSGVDTNEAVLFDIYKSIGDEANQLTIFSKIEKKDKPLDDSITLYEWIKWTNDESTSKKLDENQVPVFDPRLGEWTSLEIIRQVAMAIKERQESWETLFVQEDDFSMYIHPHNFKIPKKWCQENKNITWESLNIILGSGKNNIKIRSKSDLIVENRFMPLFNKNVEPIQYVFYALGNLLVSLLSKDTYLPDKWNPTGFHQGWSDLARVKLKGIAVSTYTRTIISSCFSKRNIETKFNRGLPKLDFLIDDDTTFDPPELNNIDDFIALIEFALKKLKNQQLLVASQQPRQLTPISLVQLQKKEFSETMEDNNTEE